MLQIRENEEQLNVGISIDDISVNNILEQSEQSKPEQSKQNNRTMMSVSTQVKKESRRKFN